MMLIAVFPQLHFVMYRGRGWQGANAVSHPDEVAYSAYTASLIRGNPRRYDPYTGRGAEGGAPESLFSIQVVPAYAIALPGRWLHLSASALFIIFPLLCAVASSLAIFWFLSLLTRDARLSAAGVLFILCVGTLIARQGIVRYVPNLNYLGPIWFPEHILPPSTYHLPFLRLYQPAVAFPLFFVLCVFVWRALNAASRVRGAVYAAGAAVVFATLIFSYFYLWTAAAAWLVCIALLWAIFRRVEFKRVTGTFAIIFGAALPAMIGYFVLLSHRAATVDSAQALVLTHRPDLFRLSEIAAFAALLMLVVGSARRFFEWRAPIVLFAASLALTVFAIFNQQVLTGRSLQPIHYEWFIGNYCALLAIVLAATLCWRNQTSRVLTNRRLAIIAVVALAWGFGEVWLAASVGWYRNRANDEFRPVASRLSASIADRPTNAATALIADLPLADRFPTDAPQTVLWAPRMLVFPGVSETEDRQRFFQQLYYLGYDERKIWAALDQKDWNFYAGLFPYYRLSRVVSGSSSPISPDEMRAQIHEYLNYAASFDRQRAGSPTLSYVIVHAKDQFDFQNLDRWYQRDQGEAIGDFILYRVKLR